MASSVTVLYGSETGTARDIAERIAGLAVKSGFPGVGFAAIDDIPMEHLPQLDGPVVFVASTTGQGDTPETMKATWARMLTGDCPRLDGLRFAVFGLGDSTYAKYNFQGKMLHNRLRQLGATALVHRGLGDESDGNGHDEELVPFLVSLWPEMADCFEGDVRSRIVDTFDRFKLEHQTPEQAKPITVRYVPSVKVTIYPSSGAPAHERDDESHLPTVPIPTVQHVGGSCAVPEPQFDLSIRRVERLTADGHFQTVAEIDFERPEGFRFNSTDAIGITPPNDTEDITFFIKRFGDPVVVVRPNIDAYRLQPAEPLFAAPPMRLSRLLATYFDLSLAAKRPLFSILTALATDEEEIDKFMDLSVSVPEYDRFCWRERRSTGEVLADFPHLLKEMQLADLLSVLPRMAPRYYSIASDPANEEVVSLCVALLKFDTPFRRQRLGLASKLLVHAVHGQKIPGCTLRPGTGIVWPSPSSGARVMLIGPGTGIAPCRSLWLEAPRRGVSTLVFTGNRSRTKDYLYGDELERLVNADGRHGGGAQAPSPPVLTHHAAFSREKPPAPAVYVQHAMVHVAAEVAEVLRHPEAVVFISGNSKRMPQDVEDTLRSIIANRVPGFSDNPEDLLKIMRAEGRFVTDTWS
jgi:NADPH-ferrihemoprotein reductase